MAAEDVLASRLAALQEVIFKGFDDSPAQVQGFVARVVDPPGRFSNGTPLYRERTVEDSLHAVRFDGYPALARAGYILARCRTRPLDQSVVERFLHCIEQQRGRPAARQAELAGDSLALLGVADGLAAIPAAGSLEERLSAARAWVRELIEQHGGSDPRLGRTRLLASDLLDSQGRFGRRLAQADDLNVAALDLCLWRTWRKVMPAVEHPDPDRRREIFKTLLTTQTPVEGEVLHAASWLCALDILTDHVAATSVPDAGQVAQVLAATQGSFRRWRWEQKATRLATMPARWVIDKEADVQAFLLAVLYPYFGDQLEDEQYLRGFGLRQGRFDFAITSLGLIVEVKMIRKPTDVSAIEAEIADDLSLYFNDGNPFTTMIVYIYDDSDHPEPQNYAVIRDALKRRSNRVVDVVIVQRPSMIPDRGQRDPGAA